jgi:hypothetical protein
MNDGWTVLRALGSPQWANEATGVESMFLIQSCWNASRRGDSGVRLTWAAVKDGFAGCSGRGASRLLELIRLRSCSQPQRDATHRPSSSGKPSMSKVIVRAKPRIRWAEERSGAGLSGMVFASPVRPRRILPRAPGA